MCTSHMLEDPGMVIFAKPFKTEATAEAVRKAIGP